MSSIRSSTLGLCLVVVLTVVGALRSLEWSHSSRCLSISKSGSNSVESRPEQLKLASCFVRNGTTGLRELGDAYLLSRGSSHLGTLRALKFSLKRALRRGELRIGVAGGSVSVGGGCYEDPEKMWFNNVQREVSNKLQDIGLNVTVTTLNIAQGATGPERMFFCGKELLHGVELDIIFLEYAINESGGTFSELLLRQASKQSAVMFVETFSSRDEREGFKSAQKEHDVLAKYYDVPIVSARDAFRDAFRRDIDVLNRYFSADGHHPSCCGHSALGGLAAAVISIGIDALQTQFDDDALTSLYSEETLPAFLDLANAKLPRYMLERAPDCMLAASRLMDFSKSSWPTGSAKKPTFDCTSPKDGNFSVNINCDTAQFQDGEHFCQVILFYTRSWQPMGDAVVYVNDEISPSVHLHAYAQNWRNAGYQWTIQQMTSAYEESLRVGPGASTLNVQCTGTTQAPDKMESSFNRTLFQFHGLVVV